MDDANRFTNIAERALELIPEGAVVGLGSGRAARAFVLALGKKVRAGFRVRGVPTSIDTAALASELDIPLATLDEAPELDLTVDGADEVDPNLDLIKGKGGALVREKIVAAASRRLIILVGSEKLVPALGSGGVLPVEVVPFGLAWCKRRLAELSFPAEVRAVDGRPFHTDNGNLILDCRVSALADSRQTEQAIRAVPGVVGTGLFLGMAETVLIQDGDQVLVRQRQTQGLVSK